MPNGHGGDLIQVKLEVLDNGNSVVDHWLLPVEHVTNEISRSPVIFTIPLGTSLLSGGGAVYGTRPMAYAIDFGMMNEMVILSGVSIDNDPDETQPTAHQLREIARTSWFGMIPTVSGNAFDVHGGVRITLNEGQGQGTHAYQGAIMNFTSDRDGGVPRWQWKLTVQVCRWPTGMTP